MIAQSEIRQMPFPEKLALLEALWIELSSEPDQIDIPQWHKDILDERMREAESGSVEIIDWEVAKQQIKDMIR
ncbi:MAG: acyl-protein synthetase [Spartobacteria bacterium]|nr:acyl-protein synthetase [Spartobacteria bacterium]